MIIGFGFCDKNVDEIRPRARTAELEYGTTIPIVLKVSTRPQDAPQLSENQEFIPRRKRVSPKI